MKIRFSQAKANGEDIRFTTSNGTPIVYQIEQWDRKNGMASILYANCFRCRDCEELTRCLLKLPNISRHFPYTV